ncbi:MAG: 3-phosphoshikimate 1-carboxyvinyltransferase [Gammaproteobacteria bacterium]|nr:3-phosphoshikimate 1-carboxyvinyltransferase [Gammaproteobacteria bacterium]
MRRRITPTTARGEMTVPGSRSITNRALVAAALADGVSSLRGVPVCDDTQAMIDGLRSLGVSIRRHDDQLLVTGRGGRIGRPGAVVNALASGTTARFLTAVACLGEQKAVVNGVKRLQERPLGPLVDALRKMGAQIEGEHLPLLVGGGSLVAGSVEVDASASSQFVSALALIGPVIEGGLSIRWGELVSRPFVEMTVEVMATFGVTVELSDRGLTVSDRATYGAAEMSIPPDAASAVYPALAAAITRGRVVIRGLQRAPSQADLRVFDMFQEMGCRVEWSRTGVRVDGPERLRAVDADMGSAPDGALAVAIAAAFADGTSRIRGLDTLAAKESDRTAGLAQGLTAMGATVEVEAAGLSITAGDPREATIDPHADHRMAMVFSVAGLGRKGIRVEDSDCVGKTWPGFYEDMNRICGSSWARPDPRESAE